ncbi:MAG: hypothetical protein M1838_004465, partial [Thelocarpon superellum]
MPLHTTLILALPATAVSFLFATESPRSRPVTSTAAVTAPAPHPGLKCDPPPLARPMRHDGITAAYCFSCPPDVDNVVHPPPQCINGSTSHPPEALYMGYSSRVWWDCAAIYWCPRPEL